ncbi:helix-turn-helix transcriptional regulator [Microbispora bryophytorum]|uniref:Helix-turn-helix transcriptional regulator n=1 Tax=Microbispora bryophytorum TaxID=1460882 RepID=A0A8H9LHC6_9ACTN|nr:AAA family ATPase [Microbispora bryophytorum]MBD3140771.1 AAA family ATPase [Microbispora bryophytorum]TQS00734.1 AAA family ATPase [Microbispora bryophytorum]GGO30816.1 helix-turn-helix transcriptional regulator [Microbispora bryophytorum]
MSIVPPPPLVGRATELRALIDAVTRPPAVVLVEGEAGIGKTRLVRAALDRLPSGDRAVLLGYCHQIREPFPYGPVFEALRDIRGRLPAAHRLNPVTGALRAHLPELAGALPPSPQPLDDPRAERHRVFRAIRALLAAVGPAVLVVEDLHWADDGTLDLLRFLTGQPPQGLAVVATCRRDGVAGPPLGRAYRHQPDTANVVVRLAPLDASGVASLAGALLERSDLSAGFVTRLHERTAGIPFVVEELVRSLPASLPGADDPDALDRAVDRAGVPLLLREAMAERMAGLSPEAARAVRAAAVLRLPAGEQLINVVGGDPAAPSHAGPDSAGQNSAGSGPAGPGSAGLGSAGLGSAGPGSAGLGSAGLAEALRAGVLHEHPGGRYGFRHALAQQAVYAAIPGPERRSAHVRAMAALATTDAPPLVQLAFHARQAGDTDCWVRHGTAAAQQAAALGDTALAVEVVEGMLDDPDLPARDRGPLVLMLSRFAATGLSHQRVVRLLRQVLRGDFLSRDVRGEVRLNLGVVLSNQAGDAAAGRPEIMAALAELNDRPTLAARGWASMAMPEWGAESLAEHAEWMARAEALVATADNPELSAAVLANRASFEMTTGSPGAFDVAARLPAEDPRAGVRREVARAYCNLHDSATTVGLYAAAERFAREGRRLALETGAQYPAFLLDASAIRREWLTGRWDGLRDRAASLGESATETPLIAVDLWLVLGLLALATGEWEEAVRQFHRAGLDAPEARNAPVVTAAAGGLVDLHLARGAVDKAAAEAERAVARLRRKGVWVWGASLVPSAVVAFARAGRMGAAAELVDEYAAGIAGRVAPAAHAALDAARGALAAAGPGHAAGLGHAAGHGHADAARPGLADAAAFFARAREAYAALPQPYAAARSAEGEARSRLALGDGAAAVVYREAAEQYGRLGATHDAARCRRVLRDIGVDVPLPRGGRRGAGALSQREREVARLVALGRTNREIADVLFLSTRTVETHVATVLRKLGVRSRTQIAPPA